MKRSQAIKELISCYQEYAPDYGYEYTFERMLTRLENLGMLPPVNGSYSCQWDEEDEESQDFIDCIEK